MRRYEILGDIWVDEALTDGLVCVEDDSDGFPVFYVNLVTFQALFNLSGATARLGSTLEDFRGTIAIPQSVIEPEAAEDLRMGLSLVDPEPSEHCIYPPCGLPATATHADGFPLCEHHLALMDDWDSLLAG